MARVDHRAAQDYRPTYGSHGPCGERVRRLPPGDSVTAGIRLLRETDNARMEPGSNRPCMGDADATARLHALRGAGWRLGECRVGIDGPAAATGIARHPHQ